MEELIRTLLTHELILNKTNEDTKGKKTLVLKVNEEFESSEEEEEDETTILLKIFARIMRKRENELRKISHTCFKCKKSGHMQFDCPEDKKENKVEKKRFKKSKKHAFSA